MSSGVEKEDGRQRHATGQRRKHRVTTVLTVAGMREHHNKNRDDHQVTDPVHLAEVERCGGQDQNKDERGQTTDERSPEQGKG